jgi:hypothetical protein
MSGRPLTVQLIAAVVTFYALCGFLLAAVMASSRDPRLRWELLFVAGAALGLSAGAAALASWRLERKAPALLVTCGLVGAAVCLALPASAPPIAATAAMWRASALGAALFLTFLLLAALHVRQVVREGPRP